MPSEQKSKPPNLERVRLVLAGIFVFIICFSIVLGVAGYLAENKAAVNLQPAVSSTPEPTDSTTKVLEDNSSPVMNDPEIKLSNIKSSLPANWKMENGSDLSVTLINSDTKISAKMMIGKCDDWSGLSCFGSGRSNYTETVNGGIYDLISTDSSIGFGLDLTKDNNDIFYIVGVDFGNHQYTAKESDDMRKIIISAFPSIFIFSKDEAFSCGASIIADVDNNIYNTVKIGGQCWLKENLKVTKKPAGLAITRYCYDNDPKICETDGGLYDWNTAMNNSTMEGAQGICPTGWHVPKDSEWYELGNNLKDEGQDCDRNSGGWYCNPAGTKIRINGSSGFDALFTGYLDTNQYRSSHSRGFYAGFWSSTSDGVNDAWYRFIRLDETKILRVTTNKAYSEAIRCIKD